MQVGAELGKSPLRVERKGEKSPNRSRRDNSRSPNRVLEGAAQATRERSGSKAEKKIQSATFFKTIKDTFGEIEAIRIERSFKAINHLEEFTFEQAVDGVSTVYRMDLEAVVDQVLERVAPEDTTITLTFVRQGLGINKSTSTIPAKRQVNQKLIDDLPAFRQQNETPEKLDFRNWVVRTLIPGGNTRRMGVNMDGSQRKGKFQ